MVASLSCLVTLTMAATTPVAAPPAADSRPNIIVFYVDDLGYGDLGTFWQNQRTSGKRFTTPALDQMAAEGVQLTHHYTSSPVCAPARASLLQGRHQGHADVRNNQFDTPLPDGHSLPAMLQAAGYYTVHVGKGGLAGLKSSVDLTGQGSANLPAHPLHRGFDRFFGYLFHVDGHEHYPANGTTDKRAFLCDDFRQVTDASLDLYTTDVWTAFAKQTIVERAAAADGQPFFLYVAYDTPHFKMQRPAVAYPGENFDGGPHAYGRDGGIQWTTATDDSGRTRYASTATGHGVPDSYTHPSIPDAWGHNEKAHVGMIKRLDNSVADILQLLRDLGLDENTICIFTSDNGPHFEGNNPRTFESYADMVGIKRDVLEAGLRVPAIVRWPGQLPATTGSAATPGQIDFPCAIWDWMPTFAQLAGVPAPAWCDGVSLLPTLTGAGTQREKGYLYVEYYHGSRTPDWAQFGTQRNRQRGEMQVLRVGDYIGLRTGVTSASAPFDIYHMGLDPAQQTNLADSLPELQATLQRLAITSRRPGPEPRAYLDEVPLPAAPESAGAALQVSLFEGEWPWVPEFRDLVPSATGLTGRLAIPSGAPSAEPFGLLFTGFLDVPTTGPYTFWVQAPDGADLFLHDAHVIVHRPDLPAAERSGTVRLAAGRHPFRLHYRHAGGAPPMLRLDWQTPTEARAEVPASGLVRPTAEARLTAALQPTLLSPAGASVVRMSYRRPSGLDVTLEDSLDLQSWQPLLVTELATAPIPGEDGWETVTVETAATGRAERFLRLRAPAAGF